jgi:predicted nucleotidyltransferase
MALTIEGLKNKNLLLFESISGSKAYGLDSAASDTDIRGVFVLDQEEYYGLHYVEQISNASNDEVYYELGRFVELLARNNPSTYCKEYKEYWEWSRCCLLTLRKSHIPRKGNLTCLNG